MSLSGIDLSQESTGVRFIAPGESVEVFLYPKAKKPSYISAYATSVRLETYLNSQKVQSDPVWFDISDRIHTEGQADLIISMSIGNLCHLIRIICQNRI